MRRIRNLIQNADNAVDTLEAAVLAAVADVVDLVDDAEKWAESGVELEIEIAGKVLPVKLRLKPRGESK